MKRDVVLARSDEWLTENLMIVRSGESGVCAQGNRRARHFLANGLRGALQRPTECRERKETSRDSAQPRKESSETRGL